MWKRVIGALVGLVYGAFYGFWTMLMTGGGHGNLTWLLLFIAADLFGLFFPIIGFFIVDLRGILSKAVVATLLVLNIGLTTFLLFGGLGADGIRDILNTWNRDPVMLLILLFAHATPTVGILIYFLLRLAVPIRRVQI